MTEIVNENENDIQLPEEEQETVVTDNGTTYESTESAIIARDEADRAKQWAEESERQANISTQAKDDAITAKNQAVSAKNAAVEAKNYAESAITDTNLVTVATDLQASPSKIKTVANNITNVNTVANISSSVTAVAAIDDEVTAVAGISSDVSKVAYNIVPVKNVALHINAVNTVYDNIDEILVVYSARSDIHNVSSIKNQITAVAAVDDEVVTVAGISSSVSTVGSNISSVNSVAENMTAVTSAVTYATLAHDWAVKMDGLVNNEDYSSKYYAQQANTYAQSVNPSNIVHRSENETITGQKTFTDDVVAKINYSRGTAPASNAYPKPYLIYDTNNKIFGCIQLTYFQNQTVRMELLAYNGANASDDSPASMGVVNNNGSKYTFAPTPTEDTTNSTQIDTVGARNTKLADYVTLSGNETITGQKTFQVGYNGVVIKNQTNGTYSDLTFNDSSGNLIGKIRGSISSNGTKTLTIGNDSEKVSICAKLNVWQPASADAYTQIDSVLRPGTDNTYNLGTSSLRWKQLFAGTTTISTSDERLKQQIDNIPDNVLDAWGEVGFYQYKFNDAVEEKGDNARYHTGMIAQRIKDTFENAGINPFQYGLLCYDEWEATEAEYDEEGNEIVPAQEAGNRYSLRYEECLCMEAAYQRRRADRIEARLRAIEEKLDNLPNSEYNNAELTL